MTLICIVYISIVDAMPLCIVRMVYIHVRRGITVFLISELAFGDACFLNGENKSPRLFYIINNAEFGGLISNIKV